MPCIYKSFVCMPWPLAVIGAGGGGGGIGKQPPTTVISSSALNSRFEQIVHSSALNLFIVPLIPSSFLHLFGEGAIVASSVRNGLRFGGATLRFRGECAAR